MAAHATPTDPSQLEVDLAATDPTAPSELAKRQKSLTIGAVCKALTQEFPDISISKIRYLEDQRLLNPRRTPGGYRLYTAGDEAISVVASGDELTSSWRITRSGRNSSRCRRRIVRSRDTSLAL